MNNVIQLLSFLLSFVFGILFALLNEINNELIKLKKSIIKIIITFLFVLNMSLLYLLIIYKFNNGIMHIYFLVFIILGYIVSYKYIKVLNKYVKRTLKIYKRRDK